MEAPTLILAATVLMTVIGATAMILKKLQEMKETQLKALDDKAMGMLNDNMVAMQKRFDGNTKAMNERLDNAAKVIGAVKQELGGMKEIGRSISDFQTFLKSPKLRGNLGEQILYDTLDQVFSTEQFIKQYKFKDGQMVDALLKTSAGHISIDSKFPMEAYRRFQEATNDKDEAIAHREFTNAVRKHIRDISSKYILPQEGTVNFAVIYIPSESVYYEVTMQHEELNRYAQEQNVMVTSPNTFFNFLHVVMMGLERAKLQEQAKTIWEILKTVQKETEKFGEKMGVLNRHVTNAKNAMDTVTAEYTKLSSKVEQIKLLK